MEWEKAYFDNLYNRPAVSLTFIPDGSENYHCVSVASGSLLPGCIEFHLSSTLSNNFQALLYLIM